MQSGSSGADWLTGGPLGGLAAVAPSGRRPLGRWAVLIWGGLAYGLFLLSLARFIGFLTGLSARDVDTGSGSRVALGVDLLLVLAFGLQHGLMSRSRFKAWWASKIPEAAERSSFVAAASALLLLLVDQWQGVPAPVWSVADPLARAAIWGAAAFGWALVVGSTFMHDHLELLGVRPAWRHFQGRLHERSGFRARWAYRFVRRPLLAGLLIALWAAPTLSAGRTLLAATLTLFVLIRVFLLDHLQRGELWEAYREQALLPRPQRRLP